MRIAVLILPEGDKALPTGDDFRRAGFAVSDAVGGRSGPDAPPGSETVGAQRPGVQGVQGVLGDARPELTNPRPDRGTGSDTPPAKAGQEAVRSGKSYCTSSKPSRASSTLIPS